MGLELILYIYLGGFGITSGAVGYTCWNAHGVSNSECVGIAATMGAVWPVSVPIVVSQLTKGEAP
jgi:hypothetical protein